MRKNSARKWLHATLDLLPVLLIPVFMIYSHRHSLTERTEVDIQYKFQTNDISQEFYPVNGNIYTIDLISNEEALSNYFSDYDFLYFNFIHFEYNNETYYYISDSTSQLYLSNDGSFFIGSDWDSSSIYIPTQTVDMVTNWYDIGQDLQNSGVSLSNCDFNVIESVDVQDTNSNIMSVFMDNFNSTVSTYFNLGNVFNMNDVYNWFNTNIFGGNAPAVIYSVYNIIVYEFIMYMLFLLYGVFMFLIDFIESLMDRVFSKTRNGGR